MKRGFVLAYAIIALVSGISAHGQEQRGVGRDRPNEAKASLKYDKKFAVIVGIDYRAEDRSSAKGIVNQLTNAEKDAQDVCDMLTKNYGYAREHVRLLLGKQATREAVLAVLNEELLCDGDQVGPEDSVLFFFAGHGHIDQNAKGELVKGFLLPVDAITNDDRVPAARSLVDIRDCAESIKRNCPARHKLFILDCCHSGAIFSDGFNTSANEHSERTTGSLFKEHAFQAITAGTSAQQILDGVAPGANDGKPQNSPFTLALLRSLKTLPKHTPRPLFTASSLFQSLRHFQDVDKLAVEQRPLCRWLSAHQGEFHFFPDPQGNFSDEINQEQARQMLLAMVPSTFGNWWMDEVPWFMPSLRWAILEKAPKSRSVEEQVNFEILKGAAEKLRQRSDLDEATMSMRLAHMDRILRASHNQAELSDAIATVVKELQSAVEPLHATDRHYLAALQHKLDRGPEAGASFKQALAQYDDLCERQPDYKPLQALCLADYGYYLLRTRNLPPDAGELVDFSLRYQAAARSLRDAWQMFNDYAPKPFQIFTLYQESTAWRNRGNYGLAEDRVQKALGTLAKYDPQEVSQLSAATWKNVGLHYMVTWQFRDARDAFQRAESIVSKISTDEHPEALVDRFHIKHLFAMVDRFQGEPEQAVRQYRKLTVDIRDAIRQHDVSRIDRENDAQVRALLYDRLVNSLERQGDCNLFAEYPDYFEAADDYRLAIQACPSLPDNRRKQTQAQLLYKRSLALMLSPGKDLDLAARLRKQADDLKASDSRRLTRFFARLTNALEAWLNSGDNSSLDALRQTIVEHCKDNQSIAERDDLEALMLASRLLLGQQLAAYKKQLTADERQMATGKETPEALSELRFQIEEDANRLLMLCRATRPTGEADPATLKYLRPYYDAVFTARVALAPQHSKELIEIAWEATHGSEDYRKPQDLTALLVLHVVQDCGFLLLDVPSGISKCLHIGDYCSLEDMRRATRERTQLALPELARKELVSLRARPGISTLLVRWHDPVNLLGYPVTQPGQADSRQVALKPVVGPGSMQPLLLPLDSQTTRFPFDCNGVLSHSALKAVEEGGIRFERRSQLLLSSFEQ